MANSYDLPIALSSMTDVDPPEGMPEEEFRHLLNTVRAAENEKLHMDSPVGINNDIEGIIEREVR